MYWWLLMREKRPSDIASLKSIRVGVKKTPSELSEQFPFIRELLDAYSIPRYELPNYEADDIIGTITKHAEKDGLEVIVITGDRDLTQLVSDKTTVYITKKRHHGYGAKYAN